MHGFGGGLLTETISIAVAGVCYLSVKLPIV